MWAYFLFKSTLINRQGREGYYTVLNLCLKHWMIHYTRAAHPDERGADEVAKKSLLLTVKPKQFMSSPLKKRRKIEKKKIPYKLFS